MASSQNNLTLTLVQQDSGGNHILGTSGRTPADFKWGGTVGVFYENLLIGTSATTITLPISPTVNVYIKNLHATQTLTITATPNGQSSVVLDILGSGEVYLRWGTASARGLTALSLAASAASTNIEMFLGG